MLVFKIVNLSLKINLISRIQYPDIRKGHISSWITYYKNARYLASDIQYPAGYRYWISKKGKKYPARNKASEFSILLYTGYKKGWISNQITDTKKSEYPASDI